MKAVAYDREVALQRAGGDPDIARRFLDMLVDLLSQTETSLAGALEQHNLEALKENAHRLGGAAPYCGALALQEAAKRLETQARAGDHDLNAVLTQDLLDEIQRFRRAMGGKRG
ncbi:MAG: Hpt domain-containing protein [Gammaproteobacteria bacterium]|jgi:HPt (histidine-containing phosphotransfer) domain-containing protein